MPYRICIIGAGGWGTTLGNLLAEKGYDVKIWAFEKETAENINIKHENSQFLPDVQLSEELIAFTELEEGIPDSDLLVSALPSQFVLATTEQYASLIKEKRQYKLISVSKGLEHKTFKLMTQILRDILPDNVKIGALSGPNLAGEVARKMPTATVISSIHEEILSELVAIFETPYFKVYSLTDEVGIEICGAAKNITAIAIGISDGLQLGDNAKGSIMTLGLTEMYRIGRAYGCKRETFFGIAGVGDLIATCSSKRSRNRFYGEKLAEGKTFEQIKEELHGMVAEGVEATYSIYQFAQQKGINLPLTTQIYQCLYEDKPVNKVVKDLLKSI